MMRRRFDTRARKRAEAPDREFLELAPAPGGEGGQ